MKVYCVVDTRRNGHFLSFVDFDSDTKFIEFLYHNHFDHFSEIINSLYRVNDSDYDSGVNYYSYQCGQDRSRYEYCFSRRFDYDLPFEEDQICF